MCRICFTVAVIKAMTKRDSGKKGFILSYRLEATTKGSQVNSSRKLEAGAEAETMEKRHFLAC